MNYVWAFLVGGTLCLIGQLLIDLTKLSPGKIMVLYVVGGVALQAAGLYEPLVKLAGAGATVPLTGFGQAIAKGASEGEGIVGILGGGFTACGAGLTVSLLAGLLAAVLSRKRRAKD